MNTQKKGTFQFCFPGLLGIHRNPKWKEFLRSRESFLKKVSICTLTDLNPGFGGPWNKLQIILVSGTFIMPQSLETPTYLRVEKKNSFERITDHVHSKKLNSPLERKSFGFFSEKKSEIFTWWWPYDERQSWWPRSTCKWSLVQPSKNSKFSNQAHDAQHVPVKKKKS